MRAPLRAPKIDKIEFSLKKVNFPPFSRNLHLIVKVTSKCIQWSIHEWKYSQCNVKYFHVGIKKFVRALWCARNFDDINVFCLKRFLYEFLWRGFYTIFSEEIFIRFSLKRFLHDFLWRGFTRFDRFNDGRITDKVWSVSRVEMIYIYNMNDSQECFVMNWLM